ncbi:MAG: MBOAT family protein [Planctomycetes bacterium]|nr:MBOAT family protein [Planctomycetota bacterium]
MVFTSFAFLFLFLPLFLAGYSIVPAGLRNLWLLSASVVFYGWERPSWVLIMVASTLVDYAVARLMGAKEDGRPGRKLLLVTSILANMGLLAWFKYANLLVHTAETWSGADLAWHDIALPVGISFYTFQSMSYTIDVYRGDVKPTRSLVDFACYVSMFPQLVAGPIVRYRDVHDQVVRRSHSVGLLGAGASCFMIGFVKKVLVADVMAPLATAGFALPQPGLVESWTALVAYSLQIYFDFSGYSDMAIGLGLMLGFRFPCNFDSPYKSQSVTEVWRRWHISLSTWLRDYLYIPLGGNRHGEARTYFNLATTMLLGGLWHGANWPFVLWGAYQGLWLCLERMNGRKPLHARLPMPLRVLATYLVFTFGWSLFVARDLSHVQTLWRGLFGLSGLGETLVSPKHDTITYAMFPLAIAIVFFAPNSAALMRSYRPLVITGFVLLFVVAVAQMLAASHIPFLYFRF